MQKIFLFATLLSFGGFAACMQGNKPGATERSTSTEPAETVKEIETVADVPSTPKSMDLFADAERHFAGGHRTMAAEKIEEGLAVLRHEIGVKADAEASPAIAGLQKIQEHLAQNEPVSADALHKAIVDVLVYAPVQLKSEVVNKTLEVDNPGGAIPKMYKEEKTGKKQ